MGEQQETKKYETSLNRRRIGAGREEMAAAYLRARGLQILERNFRCRTGEIDIIAMDEGTYVFTEVKYRRSAEMGLPQEAVGYAKQRKICRVSDFYRMKKQLPESTPLRYDVVAVCGENIEWIQNAFPYRF